MDYLITKYNNDVELALRHKEEAISKATQIWNQAIQDIISRWQGDTSGAALELAMALDHRNRVYIKGPQADGDANGEEKPKEEVVVTPPPSPPPPPPPPPPPAPPDLTLIEKKLTVEPQRFGLPRASFPHAVASPEDTEAKEA